MSDMTAEKLGQKITDAGLLESRELEAVWGELGTREVTVDQFTSLLMRRDLLTNFQLDRLIKGERSGYFYGNYKVLYLTGYSDRLFKQKTMLWEGEAFLDKPCTITGLVQAISLLLFGRFDPSSVLAP